MKGHNNKEARDNTKIILYVKEYLLKNKDIAENE